VPPAPGCYVVWHFVQTVRDQLLAADRLHPHRAEAGITLPTHAEHLLSQVRRRRGQNADDQRAGRPDGRRHVLRLSSSPSSSTACTTSIGSSTAPWVYGTLTAALGLVYADAVLVLVTCSGVAGNPPSWVIAGATLAVAALFQPAGHHIQQTVDRRFNRRSTTPPRPSRHSALAERPGRLEHALDRAAGRGRPGNAANDGVLVGVAAWLARDHPLVDTASGDRPPVFAARPRRRPVGLFRARLGLSWCRLENGGPCGASAAQGQPRPAAELCSDCRGGRRAAPLPQDRGPLGQGGQAALHEDPGWIPPLPPGPDPRPPGQLREEPTA
jgi:hypothetical protein